MVKTMNLHDTSIGINANQHLWEEGLDDAKPESTWKTVAIIPAYNEEFFIGSVVLIASQFVDEIIVIDDGSTDLTSFVAEAAGACVIHHEINRGYGAAIDTALSQVRTTNADAVVLLDGDGQHDPSQIPILLEPILTGRADMVVGSRYLENRRKVPRDRILAHRMITTVTNIGSGLRISDSQSGFRAFSRRAIDDANISRQGMSAASEFQFIAHHYGWRVEEVPVDMLYRENNKRSLWLQGLEVINGIILLIGRARPLLFISVPGLVILSMGVAIAGGVILRYKQIQELAIGFSLAALVLIQTGTLAVFTGIILHILRAMLLDLETRGEQKQP